MLRQLTLLVLTFTTLHWWICTKRLDSLFINLALIFLIWYQLRIRCEISI